MSISPQQTITLIELLSTSIVLRRTSPYLSIEDLLHLSATCRDLHHVFSQDADAWRHLDLCHVKAAKIDSSPIDIGGHSWRAERMDESLTEDDFYSGPLRGVFGRLQRRNLLLYVQTLVLDSLSVPADLVHEILNDEKYNVKVLSIREAKHLNMAKLQQALRYAVRPTRAERTPRLKALYVFGSKDVPQRPASDRFEPEAHDGGVMMSEGAQIGAQWNARSSASFATTHWDEETKWYGPTGRALPRQRSEWPETLLACANIIAFDAVLCRGPRHDITKVDSKNFLQPALALIALGPKGCENCGTCPEAPAIYGQCVDSALPLLGPASLHTSNVRAAQRPLHTSGEKYPRLILRCEDCLKGRWCERCNRWWCEDCYEPPSARVPNTAESGVGTVESSDVRAISQIVKVPTIQRHCRDCGQACSDCEAKVMAQCKHCRTEYCLAHDEGCTKTACAWCAHGGRRTRELY